MIKGVCIRIVLGALLLVPMGTSGCSTAKRDAIAIANQGVKRFEQHDFNNAYRYFQRAVEIYPDHAISFYHMGQIDFYRLKRYDEAEKNFRKVVSIDPNECEAYVDLGRLIFTRAQEALDKATHDYERAQARMVEFERKVRLAIKSVPGLPEGEPSPELLAKRKKAVADVATFQEALAEAKRRVKITQAKKVKEKEPYRKGLDDAVVQFDEGIKRDPNLALAWYFKGRVREAQGRLEDADAAYRESLTIKPIDPRPFVSLGALYAKYEAFDVARAVYTEGLKHNPEDPDLLTALGIMQLQHNKDKAAIRSFRKVITRQPDRMDAIFNIAFAYAKDKQPRQAIEYLDTYLAYQKARNEQSRMAKALRDALIPDLGR